MIVVLSLNTAVDRVVRIPEFVAGHVYRGEDAEFHAGGKGLNVARALRRLGEPVRVVGFLGGMPREFIRRGCAELGIEQRWVEIEGETRTCVIVVDPASESQTVVNEPGPMVREEEVRRLREELRRSTAPGDLLCISGSAPPGVPDDCYAQIIGDLQPREVRVLADVSGKVLRLALEAHPWAVAPNYEETVAAFSRGGSEVEMAELLTEYTEHALLTLGRDGVLYAHQGAAWRLRPPNIRTVNAVGSGDAFVAGFLAGVARGLDSLDAVRLGVACGASNASRLEPNIGPMEEIEELAEGVSVEPVSMT